MLIFTLFFYFYNPYCKKEKKDSENNRQIKSETRKGCLKRQLPILVVVDFIHPKSQSQKRMRRWRRRRQWEQHIAISPRSSFPSTPPSPNFLFNARNPSFSSPIAWRNPREPQIRPRRTQSNPNPTPSLMTTIPISRRRFRRHRRSRSPVIVAAAAASDAFGIYIMRNSNNIIISTNRTIQAPNLLHSLQQRLG